MGSKSRQLQTQKTMPCFDRCIVEMYKATDPCHEELTRCKEPAVDEYVRCINTCPLFETVYEDRDKPERLG